MDTIGKLLQATDRSEVAKVARSGIVGWRAMLAEAIRRYPDDPGRASAAELIRQLDALLGTPSGEDSPSLAGERRRTSSAHPDHSQDSGWNELVAGFAAESGVSQVLDEQTLASLGAGTDRETSWRGLHLALLRLPEHLAQRWRDRASAFAAPDDLGSNAWHHLPGECEAVLVPARAAGQQEAGSPSAGCRTSPVAELDQEVLQVLGLSPASLAREPAHAELGRLASLLLGLTALDDNLVLALESILFQGSRRLDDELRQRYRTDLLGRLGEYARTAHGSAGRLAALLDVDEAVHSLTHRPPAAAASWWAQVRQQSRRMVDQSAQELREVGVDVKILPLTLRYRDVRDLTGGNDIASRSGGEPGDVLACLRLWASIGGRALPGRVIYRT